MRRASGVVQAEEAAWIWPSCVGGRALKELDGQVLTLAAHILELTPHRET